MPTRRDVIEQILRESKRLEREQSPALRVGTRVGRLTVRDPRARRARVELDGVDVTRGYGPDKHRLIAANDLEGWIHVVKPVSGLDAGLAWRPGLDYFVRGDVRIYLDTPSDEAMQS